MFSSGLQALSLIHIFTAGITALILLPILEHYIPETRNFMNNKKLNKEDMIAIVETFRTHD